MGRYMRKAKVTGDVAVMELSQSSLGVRTRARTLALQRLQAATPNRTTSQPPPPPLPHSSTAINPESCYLQLRSRRLEKPTLRTVNDAGKLQLLQSRSKDDCRKLSGRKKDAEPNSRASSKFRVSSMNSSSLGSFSISCSKEEGWLDKDKDKTGCKEDETEGNRDLSLEAFCGENNFDFEVKERSTRESTPCSFIGDSSTIGTPGSTTRPTSTSRSNGGLGSIHQNNIPTTLEIEEFFAFAEQQQHRVFTEKYNFDVVNDVPLPGRYEWVGVDS